MTTSRFPDFRSSLKLNAMLCLSTVLMLFVTSVASADEGDNNPRVLPAHSRPLGLPYSEWAAEWWKWVTDIPAEFNPQLDESGEFSDLGQSGNVWFLGSSFGFGTWERECEVPAGKAIFFPIVPAVFWAPDDGQTEEDVRLLANEAIDGVDLLECTIDGVSLTNLENYRAESPAFTLPDTLLVDLGLPPGDRFPAVADGYWIFLSPLSKGEHLIHIRMHIADGPFAGSEHEITYYLTVR